MRGLGTTDLMLALDEYATQAAGRSLHNALSALGMSLRSLALDHLRHQAVRVVDGVGDLVRERLRGSILDIPELGGFSRSEAAEVKHTGLLPRAIVAIRAWRTSQQGGLNRARQVLAQLDVQDAMVPVNEFVDGKSRLTEAIFRMADMRAQVLLVTEKERVVGILRRSDAVGEVNDFLRNSSIQKGA